MAHRRKRPKARRTALAVWGTVVIAAGALGWGVAIGFFPARPEVRQSPGARPAVLRLRPVWLPDVKSFRRGIATVRSGSDRALRQFSGVHMAGSRDWPQSSSYEIGTPKPQASSEVRVVCGGCDAVNWAFNIPSDATSENEKLMVNAATFGVILMAGNGRLTLLEWNP